MTQKLEYSKLYDFSQAAIVLGVSLAWVERYVGNAIKQGLIMDMNGGEKTPLVTGASLKKVAMTRYGQLEAELIEQARRRIDERDRAELSERGEA